jgi:transcription initiation factor IIF auxiliary subunit
MSNHNKIRPIDKNNLNGKYKILFSTPQTKNSNIPMEFRGLQIYNSKSQAEEALKKRKKLTKILEEKRAKSMQGNRRAIGNSGGDQSNLVQFNPEVQQLKNAKIKRAKELFREGYQKTEILRIIIKEFKLERDLNSRSWPKWLSEIE